MGGALAAAHPMAKLAAAALFSAAALASLDVPTGAALIVVLVLGLLAGGVRPGQIGRMWPLFLAALLSGVSTAMLAAPGGRIHFRWAWMTFSDASIDAGAGIALRGAALMLASLVLVLGTDVTGFADGLVQQLRLPARWVYGFLAGLRLFELLGDEWRTLGQARRVRGVQPRLRALALFGQAVTLLARALRRTSAIAASMESRAFGGGARTWARVRPLRPRDWLLIGGALALAAAVLSASIALGVWRPLFGG